MGRLREVDGDFDSPNVVRERIEKAESIKKDSNIPTYTVEIPSRGIFYPDKSSSLMVSALTVKQVREVYAASTMQDIYNKEAQIIAALGDSIKSRSIYDLTLGDYDFIRYWIRLNTYKKTPLTITWKYRTDPTNPESIKEVVSVISGSELETIEIEKHFVRDKRFAFTTVRDYLDMLKMDSPDDKYIASWAGYLVGNTLEEKVEKLSRMEAADIIPDIRDYIVKTAHGVSEYVTVSDPENENQAPVRIKLDLEATDFFP